MLNGGYFDTHERYVMAVADEIRKEYEYIHSRGYILQLDAPDLAMERTFLYQDKSVDEFVKIVELHIAAVNRAVSCSAYPPPESKAQASSPTDHSVTPSPTARTRPLHSRPGHSGVPGGGG